MVDVKVIKKTLWATVADLIPEISIEEQDWRTFLIQKLTQTSFSVVVKGLKDFTLINGKLYSRGNGGVLAQAIYKAKAKEELKRIHDLSCEDNDISLYRCLHRRGYYWLEISKDVAELQKSCVKCQDSLDVGEPLFVQKRGDWRQSSLDFLQYWLLLPNLNAVMRFNEHRLGSSWKTVSYSGEDPDQAPLRCIAGDEVGRILKEVRLVDCDEHQGGSRLFNKIIHLDYYCPILAWRCQTCQLYSNRIHVPTIELHNLSTTWPFHT